MIEARKISEEYKSDELDWYFDKFEMNWEEWVGLVKVYNWEGIRAKSKLNFSQQIMLKFAE